VTCGASRDRTITAAVIGAIWSHPEDPRAAVAAFNDVFARYGRVYRHS
jgi:hypothetical protein